MGAGWALTNGRCIADDADLLAFAGQQITGVVRAFLTVWLVAVGRITRVAELPSPPGITGTLGAVWTKVAGALTITCSRKTRLICGTYRAVIGGASRAFTPGRRVDHCALLVGSAIGVITRINLAVLARLAFHVGLGHVWLRHVRSHVRQDVVGPIRAWIVAITGRKRQGGEEE